MEINSIILCYLFRLSCEKTVKTNMMFNISENSFSERFFNSSFFTLSESGSWNKNDMEDKKFLDLNADSINSSNANTLYQAEK